MAVEDTPAGRRAPVTESSEPIETRPWWRTADGGSWIPLLGSALIAALLLALVVVANTVR